jgi:hypothetical protein
VAALTLNETSSVTLDGSGNGTVRLGPASPNERWMPTLASVKVATAAAEATCRIYIGPKASDDSFVDGTFSGSSGDATDRVTGYVIARTRDPYIWAVWAGGDPAAEATLVISGTKELG